MVIDEKKPERTLKPVLRRKKPAGNLREWNFSNL
jgi:hypothetical protein